MDLHKLNLRTICLPTDADSKHYSKHSITVAKHFGSGLNYHSATGIECKKEYYGRVDGFPGIPNKYPVKMHLKSIKTLFALTQGNTFVHCASPRVDAEFTKDIQFIDKIMQKGR